MEHHQAELNYFDPDDLGSIADQLSDAGYNLGDLGDLSAHGWADLPARLNDDGSIDVREPGI